MYMIDENSFTFFYCAQNKILLHENKMLYWNVKVHVEIHFYSFVICSLSCAK